MSSFVQKALLQSIRNPALQFQRYRGKINIQRPRQPHYDRALVLAVTQPQFIEEEKTKTCFQPNPKLPARVHNPYNDIIAREVLNWLDHSRMVGIFHLNSVTQDELFKTRVALHQANMHLKSYGKKIIELAVNGTRYEAILPLFESQHCIVFSPEQNAKKLLKITRKAPQLVFMAGIVENRLLSRDQFVAYSELPGLEAVQAELVNTLNMAASNLVQNLEAHQKNFVNILDVHAKSGENATEAGAPTETSSPAEANSSNEANTKPADDAKPDDKS